MTHSLTLAQLNQLEQAEFVAQLGHIFEHTPAIAEQAWYQRPFADVDALHQVMVAIVAAMDTAAQLALIRAHPDLGSRAQMADASVREQAGAGLDQLTPEEFEHFQTLNHAYTTKFGFPFIIAVKRQLQLADHLPPKTIILNAFQQRLNNTVEQEMAQALTEIGYIAKFRLVEAVGE